ETRVEGLERGATVAGANVHRAAKHNASSGGMWGRPQGTRAVRCRGMSRCALPNSRPLRPAAVLFAAALRAVETLPGTQHQPSGWLTNNPDGFEITDSLARSRPKVNQYKKAQFGPFYLYFLNL